MDQNHWFIDGAYTFNPQWEVFGRLGLAGVRLADGYLFRDGNKLFGTAGLRGLIVQSERAAIGIIVQASAYDRYDETQTNVDQGAVFTRRAEWQQYDAELGLAAQVKFFNIITLYGGPLFYVAMANAELRTSGPGFATRKTGTAREDQYLGGFIGVRISVGKSFTITGEHQERDGRSSGFVVSYSF